MSHRITREAMAYIVSRIVENAKDAAVESNRDRSDMLNAGRRLAYYEVLDVIKAELKIRDENLSDFNLDFTLEQIL